MVSATQLSIANILISKNFPNLFPNYPLFSLLLYLAGVQTSRYHTLSQDIALSLFFKIPCLPLSHPSLLPKIVFLF